MPEEEIKIKIGDLRLILLLVASVIVIFTIAQLYDVRQILMNASANLNKATNETAQANPLELPIYNVSLITISDSSCTECFDVSTTASQINEFSSQLGIRAVESKTYEYNSTEAIALISKYNITKTPTVIISKEAQNASSFMQGWNNVGSVEADGTLVYRQIAPPYKELATGKIVGLVSMVYLNDNGCAQCYNVSLHKLVIVNRFGAKVSNESYVDVDSNEGKKLIGTYNITKVPTVIISPDLSAYNVDSFWLQYGSIEKDGSYIFRDMNALLNLPGAYRDLATNNTIYLNSTAVANATTQ
jgi:hypothetical protein